MCNLRKHVDKKVQKILSILPHKDQRHLKGLAVARIYHKIQDYPKVIKYLNLYLQVKNVSPAHKLIAHSYRLLKIPDLEKALRHYQLCIQVNPRQTNVIKEVCQLLLDEESIFNTKCANYWLDLAVSKNLGDNEAVKLLKVRVRSYDDDTEGASSSKRSKNRKAFILENCKKCIENINIIKAVGAEICESGAIDLLRFVDPELAEEFRDTFSKSNVESPKAIETPASIPPGPDAYSLSKSFVTSTSAIANSREKQASADQGNTLHLFTSSSSYKSSLKLATSSGRLSSLVPKPQHQKIDVKSEELLFVHFAKLYRLADGEWKMRGQGDVKILRHMNDLLVVMRQEKVLNLCLKHQLNTNVVYRPMDKKSWIFAARDFSEGKGALERFALRFKNQNVAREFNSAVKNALNGSAEAIKNNKSNKQRR